MNRFIIKSVSESIQSDLPFGPVGLMPDLDGEERFPFFFQGRAVDVTS